MFQSSLELSHECNDGLVGDVDIPRQFQSSLELSHECNRAALGVASSISSSFNPHSSFRTSATLASSP